MKRREIQLAIFGLLVAAMLVADSAWNMKIHNFVKSSTEFAGSLLIIAVSLSIAASRR